MLNLLQSFQTHFFLISVTSFRPYLVACNSSESTLVYASACIVDSSTGRPIAGYVNLCPSVCLVVPAKKCITVEIA